MQEASFFEKQEPVTVSNIAGFNLYGNGGIGCISLSQSEFMTAL